MKLFVVLGVSFLCHKNCIGFLKLLIRLLLSLVNVQASSPVMANGQGPDSNTTVGEGCSMELL